MWKTHIIFIMAEALIVDAIANANADADADADANAHSNGDAGSRACCSSVPYAVDLPLPDVCNVIQMAYIIIHKTWFTWS